MSPFDIFCYQIETGHAIDWDNTQIFTQDVEPFYFKRLILEMVHMKRQPSPLNKQNNSEHLPDEYIPV